MTIIFGIGGDTRRPEDELCLFAFEGNDVSFWIYAGILTTYKLAVCVEIETWMSVDGSKPARVSFIEDNVDYLRFIRSDSPMTLDWEIENATKIGLTRLINRNWRRVAHALPSRYRPKTYPAFAWEITKYPTMDEAVI